MGTLNRHGSLFGYLDAHPRSFDSRELELLPYQQEIHDTLKIHRLQGGLRLVLRIPGAGKSVLKQSLQRLPENQHLVAAVAVLGGGLERHWPTSATNDGRTVSSTPAFSKILSNSGNERTGRQNPYSDNSVTDATRIWCASVSRELDQEKRQWS